MTSEETHFMTRYSEEINITIDKEIEILKDTLDSNKDIMFLCIILVFSMNMIINITY